MRRFRINRVLAVCLICGLAGCEKIPTWGELTGGAKPPENASVTPAPQPAQMPQPVQHVLPPPPTPQEVIARFNSLQCHQITDEEIQKLTNLTEGLDLVTEINADSSPVSKNAFAAIDKLTNLRQLRLNMTRVDNEACQKIAQLSSLELLTLSQTTVSDVGVAALSALPNLKYLELNRCVLNQNGFAAIGAFPSLEYIAIEFSNLTNPTLDLVCNAKTLKQLKLAHTLIDDYGLVSLKKLRALERLEISKTRVTGEGLMFAQKGGGLKTLTALSVFECPINDKGATEISNFKSMEEINFGYIAHLNDEGLSRMISGMRKLKTVKLVRCTGLNGRGLLSLKQCKDLEELDISECSGMGDDVARFISTLKSLKRLRVALTSITPNAVLQLRGALPETTIN